MSIKKVQVTIWAWIIHNTKRNIAKRSSRDI